MLSDVLNALHKHGCNPKQHGDEYAANCPAHDDQKPSLGIKDGDLGGVVLCCLAGCGHDEILKALDLTIDAIQPPRDDREQDTWTPHGAARDIYQYTDEQGKLLFEVVRCDGKRFFQRRPDPTSQSGWMWKTEGVRKPLYRLPQVLKAIAKGEPIVVVEGERDCQTLEREGYTATCNPGGAGKWRAEHTKSLTDAEVIIVADDDDPGRKHARSVEQALEGVAQSVIRVEAAVGKDATDHFNAGLKFDDFIVVSGPEEKEVFVKLGPDLDAFLDMTDKYNWLVPGLLEYGDRLMITGWEGSGKTVWCRQVAVCVAAGIHPFKFTDIEPHRVLYIDLENSPAQSRRSLRPMRDLASMRGRRPAPNTMFPLMRPQGLDLTREDDAAWLHERVVAHKPELLIIGPVYKLHAQNPNDELSARAVVGVIDAVRSATNCAVIIEAHAGHAEAGRERGVRPLGSSLWLRWPEFGFGIVPNSKKGKHQEYAWFKGWRGPRDIRQWPQELHRGEHWPWEGLWPDGMPKIEGVE